MKKESELLDTVIGVVANVRILADSIQKVADVLSEIKTDETIQNDTKPKQKKTKVYTLEDVRGVLAEKSQNGFTTEVKCLLAKFGGSRLSDIDCKNYESIIKEAQVIGNE